MKKTLASYRNLVIPGCFALAAVILPSIGIKIGIIDAYIAQVITLAGINAILAISVNIVCGITGQLSLGQAGFMAKGGICLYYFDRDGRNPSSYKHSSCRLCNFRSGLSHRLSDPEIDRRLPGHCNARVR